jgi:hypothetical protein
MDVFNAADGTDFWTRPINIYNTGATITIRYIETAARWRRAARQVWSRPAAHQRPC